MFRKLAPAAAVLVAFAGNATLAQDTTDDAASQTPGQLDLGQPVGDGPALGSRYSKEAFGDWELACISTEAETDPCSLLQILNGPEGNPMAEVSLFRIKNGGLAVAGATVIVPLETLLPERLTIAIDENPGKKYNYNFCTPVGCIAQIGLTQDDIDAMKKGAEATVSLVPAPAPDQRIDLKMSLKGFTAGYDAVDVVEN